MSSQLNVDTIVDKAGSGGTNVKVGNTSTYVSDGGAVTQNTVQGLAKSWVNFNGTGTIAARDSLNVGSLTDNGAGDYSPNFSTNMGNASYSITMMSASDSIRQFVVAGSDTTSSYRIRAQNGSSSNADTSYLYCTIHGDLA